MRNSTSKPTDNDSNVEFICNEGSIMTNSGVYSSGLVRNTVRSPVHAGVRVVTDDANDCRNSGSKLNMMCTAQLYSNIALV